MSDVVVKLKGPLFRERNIGLSILRTLETSGKEIAMIVKKTSIESYKNQRKTKTMPSFIIDSFEYSVTKDGSMQVKAIVFAGGPSAPYAIYVDEGHTLRNGKWWEGYHFMKEGKDVGQSEASAIINKNIMKKLK